jgi:glycosyltransferase involved in cell wall biosynthesis
MKPLLSILIPTLPHRYDVFTNLFGYLQTQNSLLNFNHPTLGKVEILSDDSKPFIEGGLSIGKKREALVKRATGKYVCFLDDDDLPAPNYLETLMRLCNYSKDVVTFRNFTTTDTYWTLIDMSLENPIDEEATPNNIVKRRPWHICPVRSHYAKEFPFPDTNDGEDAAWMNQVLTLCKDEIHTDMILSSYRHSSKTSESIKIIKAGYV